MNKRIDEIPERVVVETPRGNWAEATVIASEPNPSIDHPHRHYLIVEVADCGASLKVDLDDEVIVELE